MKRRICLALVLASVATGALASTAGASYFIDRGQAIHYARDWVHYKLGYHGSWAYCRPQYRNDVKAGYIYHSWFCGWTGYSDSGNPMCSGLVVIKGSSDSGSYYHRRVYSRGDCPY